MTKKEKKTALAKEFKDFIFRGNVLDMAVGVVVGGAFTAIVSSLVKDLITPVLGLITGGIDFSKLFVALDGNKYETIEAAQAANAAILTYGNFIQAIVNFLLIAVVIFALVKIVKAADIKSRIEAEKAEKAAAEKAEADKKAAEEATAAAAALVKICPYCMTEIHVNATRCPHCTSEQPKA